VDERMYPTQGRDPGCVTRTPTPSCDYGELSGSDVKFFIGYKDLALDLLQEVTVDAVR
jgi:hypothetical protein